MSTKLTLTVDKTVIDKAKRYAKKQGRSLSDLIENYLKTITAEEVNDDIEINFHGKKIDEDLILFKGTSTTASFMVMTIQSFL